MLRHDSESSIAVEEDREVAGKSSHTRRREALEAQPREQQTKKEADKKGKLNSRGTSVMSEQLVVLAR